MDSSKAINLLWSEVGYSKLLYLLDLIVIQGSYSHIDKILRIEFMLHPREVLLDEFCVNSKGVIDWHSMEILRGGILVVVQVGMGVDEDQLEVLFMGL